MRQNRLFVFSLSLMLASSMVKAQEVKPSLLEYWFDTHIEQRQSFAVNGDLSQQIDISQLCTGIHTLEMRVGDTKGRWGAPVVKYFLKNNPVSDKYLTTYRYWIDNMSGVKEGTTSTGDVMLDIDVAKLSKGIHSLNYQVTDNSGRWSAPSMRYFLIPDLQTGASGLAAYEYWFNHGPRHRVETAKLPVLDLSNVLIEVKDVVPNSISDNYIFDAAEEMVMTPDNVFFGLQVFNGDEQGSVAVLSDTFAIDVPVDPHFLPLADNGQLSFDAPTMGMMQGLKTQVKRAQELSYTFDMKGAKVDFYDAAGNVLAVEREELAVGGEVCHVEAADDVVYALIYGVPEVFEELTVSLSVADGTGVDKLPSGLIVRAVKGQLILDSPCVSSLTIVNAAGRLVFSDSGVKGKRVIELPRGIYIVRDANGCVSKVLVP